MPSDYRDPTRAKQLVAGWMAAGPVNESARLAIQLVRGETLKGGGRREQSRISQVILVMRSAGFVIDATPAGYVMQSHPDLSEVKPRMIRRSPRPLGATRRRTVATARPAAASAPVVTPPALGAQLTVVMLAQDPKGGIALALQNGKNLYHCRLEVP